VYKSNVYKLFMTWNYMISVDLSKAAVDVSISTYCQNLRQLTFDLSTSACHRSFGDTKKYMGH
jgi:hypothetical protein